MAYQTYSQAELKNQSFPSRNAVLVSASSVNQLRQGFLGYWGDTKQFILELAKDLGSLGVSIHGLDVGAK